MFLPARAGIAAGNDLYGVAALFVLIDILGVWQHVAILFVIITSVPLTFVLMRLAMHPGVVSRLPAAQRDLGIE